MDIFEKFKSEPYFQIKVTFENGYILFINWNIFKDKKDDNKPVMRARYVLEDKEGNRLSLKVLNLKESVKFEQIYVTEMLQEVIEVSSDFSTREMIVSTNFGKWINWDFNKMINSGDFKITAMESVNPHPPQAPTRHKRVRQQAIDGFERFCANDRVVDEKVMPRFENFKVESEEEIIKLVDILQKYRPAVYNVYLEKTKPKLIII